MSWNDLWRPMRRGGAILLALSMYGDVTTAMSLPHPAWQFERLEHAGTDGSSAPTWVDLWMLEDEAGRIACRADLDRLEDASHRLVVVQPRSVRIATPTLSVLGRTVVSTLAPRSDEQTTAETGELRSTLASLRDRFPAARIALSVDRSSDPDGWGVRGSELLGRLLDDPEMVGFEALATRALILGDPADQLRMLERRIGAERWHRATLPLLYRDAQGWQQAMPPGIDRRRPAESGSGERDDSGRELTLVHRVAGEGSGPRRESSSSRSSDAGKTPVADRQGTEGALPALTGAMGESPINAGASAGSASIAADMGQSGIGSRSSSSGREGGRSGSSVRGGRSGSSATVPVGRPGGIFVPVPEAGNPGAVIGPAPRGNDGPGGSNPVGAPSTRPAPAPALPAPSPPRATPPVESGPPLRVPEVSPVVPITVGPPPPTPTTPPAASWRRPDVGNPNNTNSRIGGHGPDVNYYTSSVGFANLTHSMNMFWSEMDTADGWRHVTGTYIFGVGTPSRLSMLGIAGEWDPINPFTSDPNEGLPYSIVDNYRVRYKVTVYWEGSQGRAQVTERGRGGSDDAITNFAWPPQTSAAFSSATVQFANGDPFGEGVTRNFYKRTTQFGPVSVRGLKDHNLSVYANGSTDPLRNAIILVHDVQREVGASGSNVWETVYAGFTHENYTPFALYPTYVDAMKHLKTLRYLTFGWAHQAEWMISQSTGEAITGRNYPYNDSWETAAQNAAYSEYRDLPPTFGTARGFGNLNRPTHVAFGRSLRAACEICSALGCDLWWNHPFHSTYVGNTPGEIKVREAYLQMFAETVNQHLAPGLKVYSEWGNETWNFSNPYYHGLRYAQNQGLKLANANGDLMLRDYGSAWSSNTPWWANTAGNQNIAMFAYNAVAAAAISSYLRPLMPGRELVSVWASQDANGGVRAEIRQAAMAIWETLPWVFDELDAYAVAPYRTPPVDNAAVEAGTLTTTAAFDAIQSAGWLLPASDPSSRWYSTPGEWGSNSGKPGFVKQKQFALDLVADTDASAYFAMPDEQDKRRWNLRLIAYECGQHAVPNTTATKDFTRRLQYEPRYYDFYYRHYETLLSPGPAPMTTTRQPDGYFGLKSQFIANGEPLYDMVCDLSPIGPHGFNNSGFFWGTQQFNGEIGAPRAQAMRDLVRQLGE